MHYPSTCLPKYCWWEDLELFWGIETYGTSLVSCKEKLKASQFRSCNIIPFALTWTQQDSSISCHNQGWGRSGIVVLRAWFGWGVIPCSSILLKSSAGCVRMRLAPEVSSLWSSKYCLSSCPANTPKVSFSNSSICTVISHFYLSPFCIIVTIDGRGFSEKRGRNSA